MIIFSSLYDWLISLTSSVSLKMFLLSECPKITHSHPMSLIMAGLEAKTHLHYQIMIYMYSCKIIFAQTAYLSIHLILLQQTSTVHEQSPSSVNVVTQATWIKLTNRLQETNNIFQKGIFGTNNSLEGNNSLLDTYNCILHYTF